MGNFTGADLWSIGIKGSVAGGGGGFTPSGATLEPNGIWVNVVDDWYKAGLSLTTTPALYQAYAGDEYGDWDIDYLNKRIVVTCNVANAIKGLGFSGSTTETIFSPGEDINLFHSVHVDPDNNYIYCTSATALWRLDLDGGNPVKLATTTQVAGGFGAITYEPSKNFIFLMEFGGARHLFKVHPDGSSLEDLGAVGTLYSGLTAVPGRYIFASRSSNDDLYRMNVDGLSRVLWFSGNGSAFWHQQWDHSTDYLYLKSLGAGVGGIYKFTDIDATTTVHGTAPDRVWGVNQSQAIALKYLNAGAGMLGPIGDAGNPLSVRAYFIASAPDKQILKINVDGTTSIFYDYTAGGELPQGLMVDSKNQRMFVIHGDFAGTKRIDRFDRLSGVTGTISASTTGYGGGAIQAGEGFYEYGSDFIFWAPNSGTTGIHRMKGDFSAYSTSYNNIACIDVDYWPPSGKMYATEQTSTDQLYSSGLHENLTAKGNLTGFTRGIVAVPAFMMGGTTYVLYCERQTGRIRRIPRSTTAGDTAWLQLEVAAASLGLLPNFMEVDLANHRLLFWGQANGGTGVDGLYSVPLRKNPQVEANVTLLEETTTLLPNMSSAGRGGLGILYDRDPSSHMVDTH